MKGSAQHSAEALDQLVKDLTLLRTEFPLKTPEDKNPREIRELSIKQMKAIRKYLFSLKINPPLISEFMDALHALERLDDGCKTSMFKPALVQKSLSDQLDCCLLAAATDFIHKNKRQIERKDAAKEVLKISEPFIDKNCLRQKRTNERDNKPLSETLEDWAKQARNGKKGKTALHTYQHYLGLFEEQLQIVPDLDDEDPSPRTPEKIIEKTFDIIRTFSDGVI